MSSKSTRSTTKVCSDVDEEEVDVVVGGVGEVVVVMVAKQIIISMQQQRQHQNRYQKIHQKTKRLHCKYINFQGIHIIMSSINEASSGSFCLALLSHCRACSVFPTHAW